MPEKKTIEKAKAAKKEGQAATTQAGPFIEEEMRHVKEGKHGVQSKKQAIAIGLSKARSAGVELPPPEKGRVKAQTRQSAQSAYRRGQKEGPLKDVKQGGEGPAAPKKKRAARPKRRSGNR